MAGTSMLETALSAAASPAAHEIPHSPVAALGSICLHVAFVIAAYAAATGIVGNIKKREGLVKSSVYALYALCAVMVLGSALIEYAFITHDYTIKYVYQYSDAAMPLIYKITAYWGGLDGSLMFWVFVLSVFSTIAVVTNRRKHKDMIGYVVGVICITQVFFLALLIFSKNPFDTFLTEVPLDGKGLNPLLQTYWMAIHPPSLYVGFIAATIPFAFGVAALASGRLDNQWMKSVRVWTFICWFFLTFGLILGGRWAYEELGWGGYWAWDPVENAGLLPWFTTTAFLHSVIIQEQRGMLRVWNMSLVIITFFLTIFGTFMTRSGIVQSVHAFGEDNELALLFVLFMGFLVIVSVGLLIWRLPQLKAKNQFESFLSREFAFLLNNWILLSSAFFVLFATLYPTLSEALSGERITVGPPFFNKWMIPIGLTLLFLAGAAPLLAWRRTSTKRLMKQFLFPMAVMVLTVAALAIFLPRTRVMTAVLTNSLELPVALVNFGIVAFVFASIGQEFWGGARVRMRQTGGDAITALIGITIAKRRKFGGYIIHVGVAIMFIGFSGKCFEDKKDFTLEPGQSYEIRNYKVTYDRLEIDDSNSDYMMRTVAHLSADRNGEFLAHMAPEIRNYFKHEQPLHEVAVHSIIMPGSDVFEDLYLVLNTVDPKTQNGHFTVFVNPMINWVWFSFVFIIIGTILCLIPENLAAGMSRRRKTRTGKAAQITISLLVAAAATFGLVTAANAQAEHASGHQLGGSSASENRGNDPRVLAPYQERAAAAVLAANPNLDPTSLEFRSAVKKKLEPIVEFNAQLFKDMICLCGCPRESLFDCKCGNAAQKRGQILSMLSKHDIGTAAGREKAREYVIAEMMKMAAIREHKAKGDPDAPLGSGVHVLMVVPDKGFNRLAWAVPYLALGGALFLLVVMSKRWVKSGQQQLAMVAMNPGASVDDDEDEDEEYSDLLDDELRETD